MIRASRRRLAVLWIALGMLSSVESALLTHVHGAAQPTLSAAARDTAPAAPLGEASPGCAACHARAAVDSLVVDAHPERHGAAPFVALARPPRAAPPARDAEPAPARAPPLRIV